MNLLKAGKGSRDRVWGPVFTRGPVQFRQKNNKNTLLILNSRFRVKGVGGRGGGELR